MQDYLVHLQLRYNILLASSSTTHTALSTRNFHPQGGEILRYLRNTEIVASPPLRIEQARQSDGKLTTCQSDIEDIFVRFFSQLFASERNVPWPHPGASDFLRDLPTFPAEFREQLVCTISLGEAGDALRAMKVGSAAGPDGFPAEFYKELWPVLGPKLVALFNEVLDSTTAPVSFKLGRVVLIPKHDTQDPADPGSWRPITLINADCKLLSLVLARRLRAV